MRIILDENLPRPFKQAFAGHQITTVQEYGLAETKNGELLSLLEGKFDIFVTADQNLRYQQNLAGRSIAIIELPTNRWPLLQQMFPEVMDAVRKSQPSSYLCLT